MKITAIVVGIDQWEDLTKPLIDGINKHSPSVNVVCVDNMSLVPYPADDRVYRVEKRLGYAAAMNFGICLAGYSDWFVPMNNDITIDKDMSKVFDGMDPHSLYGPAINNVAGFPNGDFLNGWIFAISNYVLAGIGLFDENYRVNWFEDADYSWRARDKGYPLKILNTAGMGLKHLGKDRPDWETHRDKYKYVYDRNKAYLLEKFTCTK